MSKKIKMSETDQSEVIKEYLKKNTVGEVVSSSPHDNMITVNEDDTVEDILNLFRKCNILSAPVLKKKKRKRRRQ